MRKSLRLDDAARARDVFGPKDENLRRVRDLLGVRAVLRGDRLLVDGPEAAVRKATAALSEMIGCAESLKAPLPAREVERILEGLQVPGMPAEGTPPERPGSGLHVGRGRKVETKTAGQDHYVKAMRENDLVLCVGPAGTGKTYLAVAMALAELEAGSVNRICLARPAVEAGERLGFLPGDMRQKVNPYLRPLYDALQDMMSFSTLSRLMDQGVVEVAPLAYMRGRTLSAAFVILDEAQNTTAGQMLMFLTRLGVGSKAVVTGDVTQIDLADPARSGLVHAGRILSDVTGIAIVHLCERDVVRHGLVKKVLAAYDEDRRGTVHG